MTRAGRKYSIPSPDSEQIPFHRGWGRLGWQPEGQPAELDLEGQAGLGVEHRVSLSTEPAVLMGEEGTRQQYLTASLEPHVGDRAPRVIIGQNDSVGVAATVDEARRFALGILALVDPHED